MIVFLLCPRFEILCTFAPFFFQLQTTFFTGGILMITRIVLTGGPCAGKSTILKRIQSKYTNLGYAVYSLPESATMFIQAGADFLTKDPELSFVTESNKLKFQIVMEDCMKRIAEACGKPALIICDRGTMDTAAYMDSNTWSRVMDSVGMTAKELRDDRYEAVLHICTAAKGAEQFYTRENNTCRSESLELARVVDDNLIDAWKGHPVLHVINAELCFEDKIDNVLEVIDKILNS